MFQRMFRLSRGRLRRIWILVMFLMLTSGIQYAGAESTSWSYWPIKSPDWYIYVDDAGYSDEMWQTYPEQKWHENLSGEWAAAVRYDGIATAGGDSMWLTPLFICPIFQTNSTFWIETPLSTWDDAGNPTVGNDTGYSMISNGDIRVEISYTMHKTEDGTAAGVSAGGLDPLPPMKSGRYLLEITYVVTNVSTTTLENVRFFQFLHGQPNDDYGPNNFGVYDPTAYSLGAFPEYHYDITQYGDTYQPSDPTGIDMVGFSAKDAPDGWGIGEFPGNGC